MKFTKIDEALDWIMSKRRNGVEFEKFKQTVEDMGHPESKLKMIHVAGTNGKGSVVAYLRDALKAMGYKVGTLQSPHYKTHLDRIRINNQNIPDETFLRLLNKNLDFFISKDLNMFEMDYLIISCQPTNLPSRRTCERLGGKLLEIAELPPDNDMRINDGHTHECIFRFDL